jgi:membrane fusion protein (multidrug efflux system)
MRNIFPQVFLLVVLVSCNNKKNIPPPDTVKEYSVITLSPETVSIHQDFPATMEGQQVIEIRPMINGYIQAIYVNEGDRVKKGQLLFKIKNPIYEQEVITAKASINKAEADVNSAKMEIEKIKPLVERQIVSDYRLRAAELNLESNEAALSQAKAALVNAKTNLAYTNIRSTQNGMIGTIPYKTGALVSSISQQPLTTLSDIDNVQAYFSWNEKQLLDFLQDSPGVTIEEKIKNIPQATLILANSVEYPEKGKVEMASGLISTETGSATFKAVFANKQGLIRSGSSATVRIPEEIHNVVVIPQSATYELQDKVFAYAVDPDNKVSAVAIKSIPSDDGQSFFVTEGLTAGDRVVTEGINSLSNGVTIKPKENTAEIITGTRNSQ